MGGKGDGNDEEKEYQRRRMRRGGIRSSRWGVDDEARGRRKIHRRRMSRGGERGGE